jgi:hypothetical protein
LPPLQQQEGGALMDAAVIGHNSGNRVQCIYRGHGDRAYTKLKNSFLQDRRISDETRGLMARLLSLPDDWEVTVQSIIASGKAGRDKVYRMLKEAEEFGYVRPERSRVEGGKFDRQLYLVSDDPAALIERAAQELYEMEVAGHPLPENPEVVKRPLTPLPDTANPEVAKVAENKGVHPLPAKPDTAEPLPAKPLPEKPEAYKRNIDNKNNNNPPIVPPTPDEQAFDLQAEEAGKPKKRARDAIPDEYPYDFEEFWKVYPRREGKALAFKRWQKLNLGQKRRAYVALKRQLEFLTAKTRDRNGNLCPHAATWLNQGRFDDDPVHAEPAAPPGKFKSYAEQEAERVQKFVDACNAYGKTNG